MRIGACIFAEECYNTHPENSCRKPRTRLLEGASLQAALFVVFMGFLLPPVSNRPHGLWLPEGSPRREPLGAFHREAQPTCTSRPRRESAHDLLLSGEELVHQGPFIQANPEIPFLSAWFTYIWRIRSSAAALSAAVIFRQQVSMM